MPLKEEIISKATLTRKTVIAFVCFFLFLLACLFAWKWLHRQPQEAGALKPLRKVLNFNEKLFSGLVSDQHLAKTFPLPAAAPRVRVNGDAGLNGSVDTLNYKLQVVRKSGDTLFISMEAIKALPKTELVFDFKCIEGWSQVTHWGGVSFREFAKKYNLDWQVHQKYTGLQTPDKGYYVGIDNRSMLHPQTMLCYEMNGKPLPLNQGFPLRLIIPVKYGIKHLKRIGTIFFSDDKPRDYWFERGYDYFSGL